MRLKTTDFYSDILKGKTGEKRAEIMERNLKLKQESAIKNNIAVVKGNGNVVMSYVYFIQGENGGAIKIGTTTDLANRLKTLQTGYPDTLRCLLLLRGNTKLKKQLGLSQTINVTPPHTDTEDDE